MKKGFTLIELLAVIVILAIIALIAAPIVLNIIEDTKDSATLRSAEFYLDAVETAIAKSKLDGINISKNSRQYPVMKNGDICLKTYNSVNETCTDKDDIANNEKLPVEINGEVPNIGSTVTIGNGEVKNVILKYNTSIIVKNNEKLVYVGDNDENATDIACFDVIPNYEYKINYDKCIGVFDSQADDQFGYEGAGEEICKGNKGYGDLINLASLIDVDKDGFVGDGIFFDVDKDILVGNEIISEVEPKNTLSIVGYKCGGLEGTEGAIRDVIIPNKIDGKLVTGIEAFAFNSSDNNGHYKYKDNVINSVIIPNSIQTIGGFAFRSSYDTADFYNKLTSVTLGTGVEIIGYGAFFNNDLMNVIISDSVITIEQAAFYNNNLSSVTIEDGVKTIGFEAFENNELTSITIPDSVEIIGEYAFDRNKLTEVSIGSGITSIGNKAFGPTVKKDTTIRNEIQSVFINRNSSDVTIGDNAFGWADGYSNDDIIWKDS